MTAQDWQGTSHGEIGKMGEGKSFVVVGPEADKGRGSRIHIGRVEGSVSERTKAEKAKAVAVNLSYKSDVSVASVLTEMV